MAEKETGKQVRKLTAADLPALMDKEGAPKSGSYCRFYKKTWTGWEQTKCSGEYSSENECANAANYAGADGYSWTGNSC